MPDVDLFKHGAANSQISFQLPAKLPQDMLSTTASLKGASGDFNATAFLSSTAYVLFTDSDLPGPQYDVPYRLKTRSRPKGDDERFVWEKMYETFRQNRMDICGLDLERWTADT